MAIKKAPNAGVNPLEAAESGESAASAPAAPVQQVEQVAVPVARPVSPQETRTKSLSTRINPDLHKRFKIAAMAYDVSMTDALEEAMEEWIARHK